MSEEHPYHTSHQNGEITVIECEKCGFTHHHPIPTVAFIEKMYTEQFGGEENPQFAEHQRQDADYWEMVYERHERSYRQLLGDSDESPSGGIYPAVAGRRVLDIGCGTGSFLEFFKKRGWGVQGIEPSRHFLPILREAGIPVLPKVTDHMTVQDWESLGKFDVVNLACVLEHIREPEQLVLLIKRFVLKPEGILTVWVPNDFNPLQDAAYQTHDLAKWWIHPLHINYFNFGTLTAFLERCGLEVLLRDTEFPVELFLLMGDNYVGNDTLGRAMHKKRIAMENNLKRFGKAELLQDIYRKLAEMGVGREAIVHCKIKV